MPSLVDLGTLTEPVTIRGQKLEVQGISARSLLLLLQRFPELRMMMAGRAKDLEPDQMLNMMPQAVTVVIACGLGKPGDKEEEAAAEQLAVGEQLLLFRAIWRISFPEGLQSFMEALEALAVDVAGSGNLGQGQVPKSPGQSNGASQTDTGSSAPGPTPPDNSQPGVTSASEEKPLNA
jgi:hypothetical protein